MLANQDAALLHETIVERTIRQFRAIHLNDWNPVRTNRRNMGRKIRRLS
jgi:hypothetical protein